MVRRLNLPSSNQEPLEGSKPLAVVSKVKKLNLPSTPVETTAPAEEAKSVKRLNIQYTPPPAPTKKQNRSVVDDLLDKVANIDASINILDIKARIQSLLTKDVRAMLDWGDRNLVPLQAASNVQSDIINKMNVINAAGWLKDTMEASCKRPSFFDKFSSQQSPEYYEGMIRKTRTDLMKLVDEVSKLETVFSPDVRDLHLDAISLLVVVDTLTDDSTMMVASNRAKSLMAAHATGIMLMQTIKTTKLQCASFIQQIDDLLTTTIPNWKIAFKSR